MHWIKLYGEIRHDTKLSDFSNDWFGILIKLFLIADEIGKDGLIPGRASKGGYSRPDLAAELKTTPDNLASVINRLRLGGNMAAILKTFSNGDLLITNYKKRQQKPPSAEPEAVAERVKKHRENVTDLKRECNDQITTPRKIKERSKKEVRKNNPLSPPVQGGRKLRYFLQNRITKQEISVRADNNVGAMNQTPWDMEETLVFQRPK